MTDKREIRRYLWDSLEMHCLRRDAILSTVLVFLVLGIRSCANRPYSGNDLSVALVVGAVTLLPFWCFWIYRSIQIFRRVEGYRFYKCRLSSPHQRPFSKGAMYFSVVIEDENGTRFIRDTHAIFQSHGVMSPLLEEYINQTVTVGYNRETEMVVVIG